MKTGHGRAEKLGGGRAGTRSDSESGHVQSLIAAVCRLHQPTMDDIFELPSADVPEPDDGNSSADEEEGGLDWTKLPWVFLLFSHPMPFESRARLIGSGPPSPARSFQNVEKKSISLFLGRAFKNTTSKELVLRCSIP